MIESYLQDELYKIRLHLISNFIAIMKKRDGSVQQIMCNHYKL